MMETSDWVKLVADLREARKLIEKGNALEHEGYQHGKKWQQAAYEITRLERALNDLASYEHPGVAGELWLGPEE